MVKCDYDCDNCNSYATDNIFVCITSAERRIIMGYWGFENDTDQECFNHLGRNVPDSIRQEAREELQRRGYSEDRIEDEDYSRR